MAVRPSWLCIAAALAATFARPVAPAHAGLDLTWRACGQQPNAVSNIVPDCAHGGGLQLYGVLQLDSDFPDFLDLYATLDLQTEDTPVPSFWNLSSCSSEGIQINAGGAGACPLPTFKTLWSSTTGTIRTSLQVTADGVFSRHARIEIEIHRSRRDPIPLVAGVLYYAMDLVVSTSRATEAGGPCSGCTTPLAIVWNSARIVGLNEERIITTPGLVSTCVTVNGANPELCGQTPVRSRTWGAVRALYR